MGASALLIVCILLTGFTSHRFCKPKYYSLLDFSGQHLYNKLLVNGAAYFSLGLVYCYILDFFDTGYFDSVDNFLNFKSVNFLSPSINNTVFSALIFGILISILCSLSQNLYYRFRTWYIIPDEQKIKHGRGYYDVYILHVNSAESDPVRSKIIQAGAESPRNQKMIFMSDRKVYVGYVSGIQFSVDFKNQLTHFLFSPVKSGYREKDTLEVNVTTDYKEKPGLEVLLKISDVVSIRDFDEDQFKYFSEKKLKMEWERHIDRAIIRTSIDLKNK